MMQLNFGMPAGFSDLLAKKYAQNQFGMDTQRIGTEAAAKLDLARAGVVQQESDANVAESKARTTNLGLTGATIIPVAQSGINLQAAQIRGIGSEIGERDANTVLLKQRGERRDTSRYLGLPSFGSVYGGGFGGGL